MDLKMTDTIVQLNNYPPDKYNVLIPVTSMQIMSNMQRIIVNEVRLDTEVDANGSGRDIYKEKSSGKYAVTKVGGMKLAAAANISIVSNESVTPDVCVKCIKMVNATGKAQPCGSCPHGYDVKYVVTIRVPEPSGGFRLISKDKEIDGEIEKSSMTEAQYKRWLPHRTSIAESKAMMRCIRDALGLAATYTLDELKKPFIIAHIVPNLDAPEIRSALAGSYLQNMGLLFESHTGQRALPESTAPLPQAPPTFDDDDDGDPEGGPGNQGGDGGNDGGDDGPLPWEVEDTGIYCENCGFEILETKSRDGKKMWTPGDMKAFSERKFGKCLCAPCQKEAAAGR